MRWIWLAVALSALAVVAAGCGSSGSTSTQAVDDHGDDATRPRLDGYHRATDTTSTDTTSTTSGALPAGLSSECADLAKAGEKFGAAIAASSGGAGGDLQQTAKAFNEFVKAAPDELKQDFAVLADAVSQYANALKGVNLKAGETPSAAQIAKLLVIGKSLSTGKAQKASADIAAWGQKHCSKQ